jgi:hypothetical protein
LIKEAPFKSKAQARWMFAKHPEMAKHWASATPSIKKLPEKVGTLYLLARESILRKLGASVEARRGAPTVYDEEDAWPFQEIRKKLEEDRDRYRDSNLSDREQVRKRIMDRMRWYQKAKQDKQELTNREGNKELPNTEERGPHSTPDGNA